MSTEAKKNIRWTEDEWEAVITNAAAHYVSDGLIPGALDRAFWSNLQVKSGIKPERTRPINYMLTGEVTREAKHRAEELHAQKKIEAQKENVFEQAVERRAAQLAEEKFKPEFAIELLVKLITEKVVEATRKTMHHDMIGEVSAEVGRQLGGVSYKANVTPFRDTSQIGTQKKLKVLFTGLQAAQAESIRVMLPRWIEATFEERMKAGVQTLVGHMDVVISSRFGQFSSLTQLCREKGIEHMHTDHGVSSIKVLVNNLISKHRLTHEASMKVAG